ncbi:MAG: o-succinylbenzoate synthase [Flavobacteriales bacterium]|nr:o-succinylbenzoate synthase [Flavobacteriales bacterium]MCX7768696.1 o-succinylbenzoate synthase [Flavobacteriales bacterium]MDW8410105.1 o-succinylbenzoate synthase [Flavobacteriales bacterium]
MKNINDIQLNLRSVLDVNLRLEVYKLTLEFKVPAVTSRHILRQKTFYYILVKNDKGATGIGECAPLEGLSPETPEQVENILEELSENVSLWDDYLREGLQGYSSVRMGLETALLDLKNGSRGTPFPSKFTLGADRIPINGLVWMASAPLMFGQVEHKVNLGYKVVKLKIGSLDWEEELDLLAQIRKKYPSNQLELRLDANGAFTFEEAQEKLEALAPFQIHSIEQPIRPGTPDLMADLCESSPIPIALDEELIGWDSTTDKGFLLERIQPSYIILKPTLCGGFQGATEWAELATQMNIGWWATSALESNVGLGSIAQWVYVQQNPMVHGLGTGQLFTQNVDVPIFLEHATLGWDATRTPDYSLIFELGERIL